VGLVALGSEGANYPCPGERFPQAEDDGETRRLMPSGKRSPGQLPLTLPGHESAEIKPSKLRDYALNPSHESGGSHKARVFASILGFNQDNWPALRDQIIEGLPSATPVGRFQDTSWGEQWEVDVLVQGPNGRNRYVTTGWVSVDGIPNLTTAYIRVKSAANKRLQREEEQSI